MRTALVLLACAAGGARALSFPGFGIGESAPPSVSNAFRCGQPTLTTTANSTHVITLVTGYSVFAGDAAAANGLKPR